jgi:hypothetical protein
MSEISLIDRVIKDLIEAAGSAICKLGDLTTALSNVCCLDADNPCEGHWSGSDHYNETSIWLRISVQIGN